MIQRIQSVWFLLAALFGFLITQIPLFVVRFNNNVERRILATESLLLFSVGVGLACLATACIFLYKNRSLQFRLAVIGVVISVALISLEVWKTGTYRTQYASNMLSSSYYWGGLLPVAMTICFILAARGVYKDNKLIKSQDRLR